MKLARIGDRGSEKPAVIDRSGTPRDVSHVAEDIDSLSISQGALILLADLDAESLPKLHGRYGSCIARPGMILCAGLNYIDHAREADAEIPAEPILFQKATNTLVGPNDPLLIPKGSTHTDWEVELGVVIGTSSSYLPDEQAGWNAIAGYTISNDVSEREFQLRRGGQWTKGKSCESFNPVGPWLVTPEGVPNPMNLSMTTTVNGKKVQDGNTGGMLFNPGYLVWYASQFMVLEPGDLINTGTPSGVGLNMVPPEFLKPDDVIELTIDHLGVQRQICRSAL